MRKTALVSLFVLALAATHSSTVSAEALDILHVNNKPGVTSTEPTVLATLEKQSADPIAQSDEAKSKIQKYSVVENDTLSKIAEQHNTTWKRLFDKNEAIQHPDSIKVGDELTIPSAEEVLKERPLPETPQEPAPESALPVQASSERRIRSPGPASPKPPTTQTAQTRGTSSGNTYTPGYCTWYVKNRRPDLPNNLGNADTWVARAAAQGIPTGSSPRVGAVGQQGMHVVYVESVNGDGTVTISEMNYQGLYVISRRTVPGSSFMYIY